MNDLCKCSYKFWLKVFISGITQVISGSKTPAGAWNPTSAQVYSHWIIGAWLYTLWDIACVARIGYPREGHSRLHSIFVPTGSKSNRQQYYSYTILYDTLFILHRLFLFESDHSVMPINTGSNTKQLEMHGIFCWIHEGNNFIPRGSKREWIKL